MKFLSTLVILLALTSMTACSKRAKFDGKGTGGNPTGNGAGVDTETPAANDPVTTESYKETIQMVADISYSSKVKVGNNDSNLPIRNEGFKIPQTLTVTKGWSGLRDTATITLKVYGSANVVCTYQSKATQAHKPYSSSAYTASEQAESDKGLVLSFSNCTNATIDPTVVIDAFDSLSLTVVKADDLETQTVVTADIKLYQ